MLTTPALVTMFTSEASFRTCIYLTRGESVTRSFFLDKTRTIDSVDWYQGVHRVFTSGVRK